MHRPRILSTFLFPFLLCFFWSSWGGLGALLGWSGVALGAVLGHLGAVLGLSWDGLASCWGCLGASWGLSWSSWAVLSEVLGGLGAV